jgi:hypothetical protein
MENTKPIRGGGANGGRIALGHRHRVAEFYMTKTDKDAIECVCYRTPVVTFHPPCGDGSDTHGNIELRSGGWSSTTTAQFIEDVLPISCRVSNSSLVVGLNGGEYKFRGEGLMLGWVDGRLSPLNVEPDHVYRVNRKQANNVRKNYAEFTKFFMGMIKLTEGAVISDSEFVRVFGEGDRYGDEIRPKLMNDIALRNKEQVEAFFTDYIESDDHEMRYKACLHLMKQFGKRHYWKNMGYSITKEGVTKAMNDMVFARHKDVVFDVVEVPLGTIKKDSWSHLF